MIACNALTSASASSSLLTAATCTAKLPAADAAFTISGAGPAGTAALLDDESAAVFVNSGEASPALATTSGARAADGLGILLALLAALASVGTSS